MSEKLKTDLSKFNNSWFSTGANPVKRGLWYICNVAFINSAFPFYAQRRALLRLFGAEIGSGVVIKPHVNIKYPWNLKVGNNVWIGEKVWIDNLVMVELHANVCLSQGAMLITGNHDYTKSTFDLVTGKITLREGAWVGAGAKVCPGTTFGSHAVLTMGSVASGALEPYSIYQGNPAVKVKDRTIVS